MFWENLAEFEFEDAIKKCGGVCVIPLGCLEKHGQHLPMGTDTFIANDTVAMAAEMEEVMIFPTAMWLGDVSGFKVVNPPESQKMRGCIALSPELLLMTLEELCDEISRNGFKKIVILNTHGGNVMLLNYFLRAQCRLGLCGAGWRVPREQRRFSAWYDYRLPLLFHNYPQRTADGDAYLCHVLQGQRQRTKA